MGGGEGSDTAVYQDLAQANLSRMRGDKQGTVDMCLKVLREFPNNVTAHSLLGEVYMEHGELKQSAEWFEMALDLDPNATREKQLLARVRKQMQETDSKATLEQLEVKPRSGLTLLWASMVGAIILVGLLSFFIGRSASSKQPIAEQKPAEPIRIPAQANRDSGSASGSQSSVVFEDGTILSAIKSSGSVPELLISALYDPSTEGVTITGHAENAIPYETTALLLAADAFVGRASARSVTVRLVKESKVVFVGTMSRDSYDELQATSRQSPIDELGVMAFPSGWHSDASMRPGSPVVPPKDEGGTGTTGTSAAPGATGDTGMVQPPAGEGTGSTGSGNTGGGGNPPGDIGTAGRTGN